MRSVCICMRSIHIIFSLILLSDHLVEEAAPASLATDGIAPDPGRRLELVRSIRSTGNRYRLSGITVNRPRMSDCDPMERTILMYGHCSLY